MSKHNVSNRYQHTFRRYDRKILVYIALFVSLVSIVSNLFPSQEVNRVEVYYDNTMIFTANLDIEEVFELENTDTYAAIKDKMTIEVSWGKVRVSQSNSTKRDCSSVGWISESNQQLVCLENKIVIKVKKDNTFKLPGDVIFCDVDGSKCPL